MPRGKVEWFMAQAVHDNDKIQARQSCSYYSVLNVNKNNYPYLSSYEREQTWTLTRTISNNHKRYQSSIDNIHLTIPASPIKTKHHNYENINVVKHRSNSLSRPQKYVSTSSLSSSSLRSPSVTRNTMAQPEKKTIPIKTILNSNADSKFNTNTRNRLESTKFMRTIPTRGDFIIRI